MEFQKDVADPAEFYESVRVDLFPEEVYVFTPKGDVKTFPRGATPIDFAYSIHSEVGHTCNGARVNGVMVPLRHKLRNGDVVEMNRRLEGGDHSLNVRLRVDSDTEWLDWLVDDSVSQETTVAEADEFNHRLSLLHRAMTVLNEREQHILRERRLKDEPTTLEELSGQYSISRERVRQIEVRAFEKVQRAIKALEVEQAAATAAALPPSSPPEGNSATAGH